MNRKREKSLNGFSKYCKTPEEVISGVKNHISKTDKFAFLCGFFMFQVCRYPPRAAANCVQSTILL